MGKQEAKVEQYLNKQIVKRGGITRKWICQTISGVPDRICFLPGGIIFFVEVKTDTGKCSSNQIREQQRIDKLGASVFTVFGKGGVDNMLKEEYDDIPGNEL